MGSEQVPGVAGTFPIPCSHSALEGSKVHFAFFFSLVPSRFSDFNSCPGSLVAQLCTRTSIQPSWLLASMIISSELTAENESVKLKMRGPQASPRAVAFRGAGGPNMRFLSFPPFF